MRLPFSGAVTEAGSSQHRFASLQHHPASRRRILNCSGSPLMPMTSPRVPRT
jgi:hypothetical protein